MTLLAYLAAPLSMLTDGGAALPARQQSLGASLAWSYALLTPGEAVTYLIRMNPTSNLFLPGHRLRLDVMSSDFPNYDRNHNTPYDQNADTRLVVAEQVIHHGGPHASRIILPRIP